MISDYMYKKEIEKYYEDPQAIIDRAHRIRNEMMVECSRMVIQKACHVFKSLKCHVVTRIADNHVAPLVSPKRHKL